MLWVLDWVQNSALGLFRPWKIGYQWWGGRWRQWGVGGEELPLKENRYQESWTAGTRCRLRMLELVAA